MKYRVRIFGMDGVELVKSEGTTPSAAWIGMAHKLEELLIKHKKLKDAPAIDPNLARLIVKIEPVTE